ncbi:hypothetical protein GC194_12760 [bacterium]|nr:hypothetical protein [bacterium]
MKHLLFSILLMSLSYISFGQPVLNRDIFPDLGESFQIEVTNFSPDSFPRQLFYTWENFFDVDLSGIPVDSTVTERYESPDHALGGADISNAEMAFETPLGVTFARKDGDRFNQVGVCPTILKLPVVTGFQFDKPLGYYDCPIEVNTVFKDSTTSKKDLGLFKVNVLVRAKYEVNGYGNIKLKSGSYKVLRLQREFEFIITTIPLVGNPVKQRGVYVNWEFLSEKEHWPIPRAATLLNDLGTGNQDTVVRFEVLKGSTVDAQAMIVNQGGLFINENGIQIDQNLIGNYILQLIDLTGRAIIKTNISSTVAFDTNSLKGMYLAILVDDEGKIVDSKKIIKR